MSYFLNNNNQKASFGNQNQTQNQTEKFLIDDNNLYFEGWFYKQVTNDQKNKLSLVAGLYINKHELEIQGENNWSHIKENNLDTELIKNKSQAFILLLLDQFPKQYYAFDLKEFETFEPGKFNFRIKDSYFNLNGFKLNITEYNFLDAQLEVEAQFSFKNHHLWEKTLFQPSILGFAQYVPILECYHDVVSQKHNIITGNIKISNKNENITNQIDFSNGIGYIEKDYGINFPSKWVWIQSNHFEKSYVNEKFFNKTNLQIDNFFFSIGKVPFLGLEFDGLISTLLIGDKTYSFSSTIGSIFQDMKISGEDGNKFEIVIVDWFQRIKLYIKGDRFKQDHQFYCPTKYGMKKKVKETLDGHAEIKLTQFNYLNDQETIIVEGITKKAGIEVEW